MSDSSKDAQAVKKWRDKYLNLIDQHEKLEQSADHNQGQLRKALVMVSLLAEGQAESLDEPLQTLRDAIKPKEARSLNLESLLEQLKNSVNKYEQNRDAQAEQILEQLHAAASQLLKLPLAKDEKARIKATRKDAKKQLKQWSGYAQQLQAWGTILSNLTLEQAENDGEKEGFLSRLFKRSDNNDPDESDNDQVETEQTASIDSTVEHPGFNENDIDIEQLVKNASEALKAILAQLVIPARLHPLCDQLQKKLDQKLSWQDLIPVLQQVGDLIIESLSTGQHDFEQFLQGLNEQLEVIQVILENTSSNQSAKQQASAAFDLEIKNKVDEIHSLVAGHEQLGNLGSSIQQHLDSIITSMENYRQAETSREQELTKQLHDLQKQLADMEKTAKDAQAAIEEHRYKAMHDKLTGLPNREAYEQRLNQELMRVQRYKNPLTLLVCDIDFFKRINDTYGHQAGDRVLQLIAKTIQKYIRDVDFVARFGGEEFVILMPETASEQAFNAAEKLREVIANAPFSFKKERVQITISIGISQFGENEMESKVFERADKALYQAKEQGRNRCIIMDE